MKLKYLIVPLILLIALGLGLIFDIVSIKNGVPALTGPTYTACGCD